MYLLFSVEFELRTYVLSKQNKSSVLMSGEISLTVNSPNAKAAKKSIIVQWSSETICWLLYEPASRAKLLWIHFS